MFVVLSLDRSLVAVCKINPSQKMFIHFREPGIYADISGPLFSKRLTQIFRHMIGRDGHLDQSYALRSESAALRILPLEGQHYRHGGFSHGIETMQMCRDALFLLQIDMLFLRQTTRRSNGTPRFETGQIDITRGSYPVGICFSDITLPISE